MLELNLQKFNNLLQDKPFFDVVGEKEKVKKEKSLFFSVVCEKTSLKECEELSYDDLLSMMFYAEKYITGIDAFSEQKSKMLKNIVSNARIAKKRLL